MGRFASPDTIVPGGVQGLDRYAYVNNSPLNFVDPSGHDPVGAQESGYWVLILSVNLATSGIPRNTPEAQYAYAEVGALLSQKVGYDRNYNLCGDIALSVVLETVTGQTNTLPQIFDAHPSSRTWNGDNGGLGPAELAQEMAGSFPPGWTATSYSYSEVTVYHSGSTSRDFYDGAAQNSASNWTQDDFYSNILTMLMAGDYVLIDANLSLSGDNRLVNHYAPGVPHWVTLTG